jgi:hypothetical protein
MRRRELISFSAAAGVSPATANVHERSGNTGDFPMASSPSTSDATSQWPSIERQLTDAKAINGSKFEEFIRASQETNLLRPGEHHYDGIGVPLWLRVYYRKQHPDEPSAPAGPAGDYPEALNRIQELMQVNQDLRGNHDEWLNVSKRRTP